MKIFPILPSEIQLKIISFCDPEGLIILSGVNVVGSRLLVLQKTFNFFTR